MLMHIDMHFNIETKLNWWLSLIDERIYKKVGEWENEGSRQAILDRLLVWLDKFSDADKDEIITLLSYFDYYSDNKLKVLVTELYGKFVSECSSNDVIFSRIEKGKGVSFSSVFFENFWRYNKLYNNSNDSLLNSNDWYYPDGTLPKNIVIVDDYFGSGDTFKSHLENLIQKYPEMVNCKIYFLALHGSKLGKESIEKYKDEKGIDLQVITLKDSPKAFEENYIFSQTNVNYHKSYYSRMFDKYCGKMNDNAKFGYNDTEALVSFEYNTPNNTLGLFYKKINDSASLFERVERKRTCLNRMQKKQEQNAKILQESKAISIVPTTRENVFLVYCIAKGGSFNAIDACKDFGLTNAQLDNMLFSLIDAGYMKVEDGKYMSTNKIKDLTKSAIKQFGSLYYEDVVENEIENKEFDYIPKNFKESFGGYNRKEG